MCEINFLKVFNNIHQLALLQDSSVSETGSVVLQVGKRYGDPNLLDQSGLDSVSETLYLVLNTHGCWTMSKTSIKFNAIFQIQNCTVAVLSFSTSNSEVANEKNKQTTKQTPWP
jgi:hypothetical protein